MYLQRVQQRLVHETRYAGDCLYYIINLSKLRHYRVAQSLFFKTRVRTNLSSENNLAFTEKFLHIEGSHTWPCLKPRVKKTEKVMKSKIDQYFKNPVCTLLLQKIIVK